MSKYRLEDGTVIDTEKAKDFWEEATDWDGRNHISRPTGSQWEHERLYLSARGRYYVESWSQWQGSISSIEVLDSEQAARWLILNDHENDLPEELRSYLDEVVE